MPVTFFIMLCCRNRTTSYDIHINDGEKRTDSTCCAHFRKAHTEIEDLPSESVVTDQSATITQNSQCVVTNQPATISQSSQCANGTEFLNQANGAPGNASNKLDRYNKTPTERQREQDYDRLHNELARQQETVKRLEEEKHTLLSRLSEVYGRQLEKNNPNITNLNDRNRPQKVGEMFVSIYDNDWTDAFSRLDDSGIEQRECIEILLDILKMSFDRCWCQINKFYSHIKEWFDGFENALDDRLNDCITPISQTMISFLTENTIKDVATKYCEDVKDKCNTYVGRCVRMCYSMVIKAPPMFLCFECTVLDKQEFKVFTKDGDEVDYLVWPALYLYENGPLMEKGVVQCK